MEPHPLDLLTPREREVLALMAQGLTNAQIADRLGISFPTAKTHVSDILSRFGVDSREEAIALINGGREVTGRAARRWLLAPLARLALGGAAALAVVGGVTAVAAFRAGDGPPPDELRVPFADLQVERPAEFHVPQAGVSQHGVPYPVWLVRHEDGSVDAFIGRDPHGGCTVPYLADYEGGGGWWVLDDGSTLPNPSFTGGFKALCTGWAFNRSGEAVFGAVQRGLDGFPTRVEGDDVVVDLTRFVLGACRLNVIEPCSQPGNPIIVDALPPPWWIAGCPEVPRDHLVDGACPSPTP